MLQAYEAEGIKAAAVFELFFRELPPHRNYVMVAGLDDVLSSYMTSLRTSRTMQCSPGCASKDSSAIPSAHLGATSVHGLCDRPRGDDRLRR